MSITWGEFKRVLADRGVRDDDVIFYIDTGNYPTPGEVLVSIERDKEPREFTVS